MPNGTDPVFPSRMGSTAMPGPKMAPPFQAPTGGIKNGGGFQTPTPPFGGGGGGMTTLTNMFGDKKSIPFAAPNSFAQRKANAMGLYGPAPITGGSRANPVTRPFEPQLPGQRMVPAGKPQPGNFGPPQLNPAAPPMVGMGLFDSQGPGGAGSGGGGGGLANPMGAPPPDWMQRVQKLLMANPGLIMQLLGSYPQ